MRVLRIKYQRLDFYSPAQWEVTNGPNTLTIEAESWHHSVDAAKAFVEKYHPDCVVREVGELPHTDENIAMISAKTVPTDYPARS